jgi:tellurite resistance protein TerC
MLAVVQIAWWHWAAFIAGVVLFLCLDLGVFHRHAHVVKVKEAFLWTVFWFSLAMLFALGLKPLRGDKAALQFVTGYMVELSLSMDNVFVIALIFSYFGVPQRYQHRVLFWGILGALVMRGAMIGVGIALINLVSWVLYVFGAFLLYSGLKMLFVKSEVHPEKNRVVQWVRKVYPVTPTIEGQHFTTKWEGRTALTPLALVLVMVETTDLLFAMDSIPAVFAVTRDPFVVFTSNVFAILGLRSLYFLLAGALGYFRYLKYGLSFVLIFMGVEMLLDPHDKSPLWFQIETPTSVSLLAVAGILLVSMVLSIFAARRERRHGTHS